jgi:hypothetical protein
MLLRERRRFIQNGNWHPYGKQMHSSELNPALNEDYVPVSSRLFECSTSTPITLAERFPRVTVAAIAIAMFAFAAIAEIDFLSGAGYHWK